MFGLFRKAVRSERDALKEEFERITKKFRQADATHKMALGVAINMANTMFVRKHSSMKVFKALPQDTRFAYIKSLTRFEENMAQQDPITAIGFGLVKMWIAMEAEGDTELANQFSNELTFYSRLAP